MLVFIGEEVTSATAVVHGILSGIPVPFPIKNTDVCKDCGLTCPVAEGKSVEYHADIAVKEMYPKVSALLFKFLK